MRVCSGERSGSLGDAALCVLSPSLLALVPGDGKSSGETIAYNSFESASSSSQSQSQAILGGGCLSNVSAGSLSNAASPCVLLTESLGVLAAFYKTDTWKKAEVRCKCQRQAVAQLVA